MLGLVDYLRSTNQWTYPAIGLLAMAATCLAVVGLVIWTFFRLLNIRRLLRQEAVLLTLTPPAFEDKEPLAMQELFVRFHGWDHIRPLLAKLVGQRVVMTFEIIATKYGGIRFVIRIPKMAQESVEKDIAAFSPAVRTEVIEDYVPESLRSRTTRVVSFRQAGKSFAYPLQEQPSFGVHDPIAYLTEAMTNLDADEMIVIQLVTTPTTVHHADRIARHLLHNDERLEAIGKQRASPVRLLLQSTAVALLEVTNSVGTLYHGPAHSAYRTQQTAVRSKQTTSELQPVRSVTAIEQELATNIYRKLSQPLFQVAIRTLIVSSHPVRRLNKANDVRKALGSLGTKYQSLAAYSSIRLVFAPVGSLCMFRNRLPDFWWRGTCILSASELAALFHFPHSATVHTENVVKSLSRSMPLPLAMKNHADKCEFDVELGRSAYLGRVNTIGLTAVERERHLFVVGGTGSGKSTLIKYAVVQDIQRGKGVAVIDPHGDLAQELLGYVPKDRVKDVVYFNPDDLAYPVGLNVLELSPGLKGDDLVREKDIVAESVVSLFHKLFSSNDSGGHRIEYVLRNAIHTALSVEGATLFTVYNLLNDPSYCKSVVNALDNTDLRNFWNNELGRAGSFQRVKMVAGITAKIGRFLFSASAKRVLEQSRSTINFDEILDGKILICNFSKGLLGEDTSELFGVSILTKIQLAALRRARIAQAARRPFYLYVDEFQNFATPSFVQMLSESRKYRLSITMAEQTTSQQEDQQMVHIILANVGTTICFRTGNPADESLLQPFFSPYIRPGDIANLPPYNFYMRVAAATAQEPLSGETVLVDSAGDEGIVRAVIHSSRHHYARKRTSSISGVPQTTARRVLKNADAASISTIHGKSAVKKLHKRNARTHR